MSRALVVVLVALFAGASHAGERTVSFAVDKDGLTFTGPCAVTFFDGAAVALAHPDASEPATLPAGKYDAVLSCPSTEGALATTVAVDLRSQNASKSVRLRPAFVLVNVVRDKQEVAAEIVVTDASGREVQRGKDKVALPVPPGKLSVLARVDKKVAGTTRNVFGEKLVTATVGKKATETVDTSDGTLVLAVTNNGKPARGIGALRVAKTSERLVEVESDQDAPVPPGSYDLVVQLGQSHDFAEVVKPGVKIAPGKVTKVTVDHKTGELAPRMVLGGRAPDDDEEGEVELFLGAAPAAFNTLAKGEVAILKPGKYRVLARLKNKKLDDGAPYEGEGQATVTVRGRANVVIDLSPATLDVSTKVGGKPRALEVGVYKRDGEAPVASKQTGDDGDVSFALSPGRYRVTATLAAAQGIIVTEAFTTLERGRRARKVLDLDVGTAVVQVFEGGVAVPAEVMFFQADASAPLLSVPAGQEAFLPPGSYALSVRRAGKVRSFAEIKIASGRVSERQLELNATVETDTAAPPPGPVEKAPPPPPMPKGETP